MDSEFSPVAVIVESKQLTCHSSDMQLFGIFVLRCYHSCAISSCSLVEEGK